MCGQVGREGRADANRSSGRWVEIFQEAGLKIVKEEVQEGLPEELFTVKTYVLYIYIISMLHVFAKGIES